MLALSISVLTAVVVKRTPPRFHVNSSHVDALTCIICQSLLENFAQISSPPDASLAL